MLSLGENQIFFDFEDLEPVTERVKLEGSEYERSNKRRNKEELTATANVEVYRSLECLPIESKLAMREAISDALLCGQLLGYPMVNTRVRVLDGRWSNLRSRGPLVFQQSAVQMVKELIQESKPCLLEPFMKVELDVPDHIIGDLLSDITGKRGGRILGIRSVKARFVDNSEVSGQDTGDQHQDVDQSRKAIFALLPLSEMVGYNTYLRSVSKGEAQFTMSFSHYEQIGGAQQAKILDDPFYY